MSEYTDEKIIDFLKKHPSVWYSTNEIRTKLNIPRQRTWRALNKLYKWKEIEFLPRFKNLESGWRAKKTSKPKYI